MLGKLGKWRLGLFAQDIIVMGWFGGGDGGGIVYGQAGAAGWWRKHG